MKAINIAAFLLIIFILFSCENKNESLEKLIAKDVPGVICINMPNVVEKSTIKQGDDLLLPQELKDIIKQNEESALAQFIRDIPNFGIEMKDKAFVLIPKDVFSYVVLISLNDESKARTIIEHRNGAHFETIGAVDAIISANKVWAVEDNILFVGCLKTNANRKEIGKQISNILDYDGPCVTDNNDASDLLSPENDITAYFNVQVLNKVMKSNPVINHWVKNYPIMQIAMDSDIKAIKLTTTFKDYEGVIKGDLILDDNSQFGVLLESVLGNASNEFLKTIPNTMSVVASMSVDGETFAKLPQVKQMINVVNNTPFMGGLNLDSIVRSIDGSISVGIAQDPTFEDEYNYVFAVQSNQPSKIVNLISEFASTFGQDPEIYNGEYLYSYYNKQVKVGITGNVVYVKMLNYEQFENNSDEIIEMKDFFKQAKLGVYSQMKDDGLEKKLYIGLTSKTILEGKFEVKNKKANALLEFLKMLCQVEPVDEFDYDMSNTFQNSSMTGNFNSF